MTRALPHLLLVGILPMLLVPARGAAVAVGAASPTVVEGTALHALPTREAPTPRQSSAAPAPLHQRGQARGLFGDPTTPRERIDRYETEASPGGRLRIRVPAMEFGDEDMSGRTAVRLHTGDGGGIRLETHLVSLDMVWAREVYHSMAWSFERDADGAYVISAREPAGGPPAPPVSLAPPLGVAVGAKRHVRMLVDVWFPERFDLDVEVGTGDVELAILRGDAAIATGDGQIAVQQIEGAEVRLSTGAGDILVTRLDAADAVLRTDAGDIGVVSLTGRLYAASRAGNLSVAGSRAEEVSLRTGEGDVTLGLQEPGAANVATDAGNIFIYVRRSARASFDLEAHRVRVQEIVLDGTVRPGTVRADLNGGGPRVDAFGPGEIHLVPGGE